MPGCSGPPCGFRTRAECNRRDIFARIAWEDRLENLENDVLGNVIGNFFESPLKGPGIGLIAAGMGETGTAKAGNRQGICTNLGRTCADLGNPQVGALFLSIGTKNFVNRRTN